jgi:hypothetical protein
MVEISSRKFVDVYGHITLILIVDIFSFVFYFSSSRLKYSEHILLLTPRILSLTVGMMPLFDVFFSPFQYAVSRIEEMIFMVCYYK